MKILRKSRKQQALAAELELIIDDMGQAMRDANKEYIAQNISVVTLTPHMRIALDKFKWYCAENYGR